MAQKRYFVVEMEISDDATYNVRRQFVDEEWVHDRIFQLGFTESVEVEEITERMAHNNYHKRSKKV